MLVLSCFHTDTTTTILVQYVATTVVQYNKRLPCKFLVGLFIISQGFL